MTPAVFTYHTWGYPRPVGLKPRGCCSCESDLNLGDIVNAVRQAISESSCCENNVCRKIESAKTEIIQEVKNSCKCCKSDISGLCGIEMVDGSGYVDTFDITGMTGCCFGHN